MSNHASHAGHPGPNAYLRLAIMAVLSFVAMYVLMYAMVDRLAHVYSNANQGYMAGVMTAPMVIIELAVMGVMYTRRNLNIAIVAASIVLLGACWFAIRYQAGVGDVQFARSMIPHHSGAILMCREASLADAELRKLCGEITQGQQREIVQMQNILSRLR